MDHAIVDIHTHIVCGIDDGAAAVRKYGMQYASHMIKPDLKGMLCWASVC